MRTVLTALLLSLALAVAGCTGSDDSADAAEGSGVTDPATTDEEADPATSQDAAGSTPVGASEGPPVPVEGEGDMGDGSGLQSDPETAPSFGVSSETDSDAVAPFTSCWDNGTTSTCADGVPSSEVTLTAADQLVVTYEEGQLSAASSETFTAGSEVPPMTELPVEMENPGIWLVDISGLPDGDHAVHLSWNGRQGDSFAVLDVDIAR